MGDPIRLFPDQTQDGGLPASEHCELNRTLVSGNVPSVVDATGAQLYELADASYSNTLTWTHGVGGTLVRIELSDIKVYSVDATRNIDYARWSQTEPCEDHITIEATLSLKTEDGRLDESVPISLVGYDDYEAHGSVTIAADQLKGTYESLASGSQCFQQLKVRMLIARDGTSGTLGEEIEAGSCDDPVVRPSEEYAAAKWGKRAYNYGD